MNGNSMPALSADELGALRSSIERDGVIYPVLLDRAGDIIDGFHRTDIAAELGIECPTHTLMIEPERAGELRITLNLARRQMTRERWYALIRTLTVPHQEAIRAEEARRRQNGGGKSTWGSPPGIKEAPGRIELARRVNADLKAIGIDKTISGSSAERIVRTGTTTGALNPAVKSTRPRPKKRTKDPRTAATNASLLKIREADAYSQYRSMHNAPPRKLNLPMIRRAGEVQLLLVELSSLDPEVAVTQIPIERCRQWLTQDAKWWMRFTELCEERWAAETPDVPLMRYPRKVKLTKGQEEEYQLPPIQASIVAWLGQQDTPQLNLEIANGIRAERSSVQGALDRLCRLHLVRETTGHNRNRLYEIINQEGDNES